MKTIKGEFGEFVRAEIARELLDACKAALKCIANLTPFDTHIEDEAAAEAVRKMAEYADDVRSTLRKAIEATEDKGD